MRQTAPWSHASAVQTADRICGTASVKLAASSSALAAMCSAVSRCRAALISRGPCASGSIETRDDYSQTMVVICESCGKKNRVGAANLAKQVNCGACKSPVTPIARPIDADIETFEDVAQHSPLPALVDFWADWCGPCKMAAPFVARV